MRGTSISRRQQAWALFFENEEELCVRFLVTLYFSTLTIVICNKFPTHYFCTFAMTDAMAYWVRLRLGRRRSWVQLPVKSDFFFCILEHLWNIKSVGVKYNNKTIITIIKKHGYYTCIRLFTVNNEISKICMKYISSLKRFFSIYLVENSACCGNKKRVF